jgi:hypothetical protein
LKPTMHLRPCSENVASGGGSNGIGLAPRVRAGRAEAIEAEARATNGRQ